MGGETDMKITKAYAEAELKEARTLYEETLDDYLTDHADYNDLLAAIDAYNDAIKLLRSLQ